MNDFSFDHIATEHYTVFDGLGGMHIEDLYQDREGFLWIATADGGVSRFDSVNFDSFGLKDGLPNLTVMGIAEDADGRLLFGTFGGGLAAYDGRGFQVYTTEHGLPSNQIVGLQAQSDGSVLVLTGAGVAWFAEGRCIKCLTEVGGQPLGRVYDMVTDAAGTTWLATWKRGVVSLDGRRMDTGEQTQWPWQFAQDAAGHLWIAFHYTGPDAFIGCYDARAEQFAFLNVGHKAERAVQQGTRHVRVDDRGWVWMARRGVFCYDGQAWHHFAAASLPDIDFSATRLSYEDREGNVWVGLWGGGLIFCDPVSVRYYTEADGLPDHEVRHLGEDAEGRMWIGTMSGMAGMEDGRIQPLDQAESVSALLVDQKGQVWSGGDAGRVYQWDGQTPQAIAAPADEITGLYEDGHGRIWVGTGQSGFGLVADGHFTRFSAWDAEECRALLQDQNGMFWVGCYARIPALYWYADGSFRPADMAEAETIAYVHVLWEHQNTVWVGTAQGLFAHDLSSGQVRHFTADQSGLSANGILALAADQQGDMWVGTSGGGVLRYDGETFQSIRLGSSALGNIVEAVLCDRAGRMWFGTRAGLVAYQPGDTPPGLVIREVLAGARMAMPDAVSCPEDTPEIRIHFQGISFRSGAAQMRYRHRLVGHGPASAWSALTAADAVAYRALPVGDYRFEVQTIDRDGLESAVVGLDVHVLPDVHAERLRALAKTQRPTDGPVVQSRSPAMQQVMQQVAQVADTSMNVLVLGETGTGKGVLAHTIHDTSRRCDGPFVHVNCGGLPPGLLESELFGHEKGAFTGAGTRQLGRFELADGGTLFLDEIGNLPLEAQQVLLNILEEQTLTRVGGQRPVRVDVRVVAATNRDLAQAIDAGAFREDLFYRLSGFTLELPPLRQRPEDILALVAHFVERFALDLERSVPTLADGVVAHLQAYAWPGNIRELEHVLHRAVLLSQGGVIQVEDLSLRSVAPPAGEADESKAAAPADRLTEVPPTEAMDEKQQILAALQATHWRVSGVHGAAALLDMHPEKLRYRMQKYGLRRPKK